MATSTALRAKRASFTSCSRPWVFAQHQPKNSTGRLLIFRSGSKISATRMPTTMAVAARGDPVIRLARVERRACRAPALGGDERRVHPRARASRPGRPVASTMLRSGAPSPGWWGQLRPWDLVQPGRTRVSPANHRGGGWDFEPVTASSSVGRIASEPCGSDCGWRRVARFCGVSPATLLYGNVRRPRRKVSRRRPGEEPRLCAGAPRAI